MQEEVSKALSKLTKNVYQDAVSPSAKEIGKSVAKVVKIALTPVNGVVWTVEQAFDWVGERVTKIFLKKKIPTKQITSPPILIEGRILQQLQTLGPSDDYYLKNMFAALLASSMNKEMKENIHPTFVNTLAQLTTDEAMILSLISHFEIMVVNAWNHPTSYTGYGKWNYHYYDEFKLRKISDDDYWYYWHCIENLEHLGIVKIHLGYEQNEKDREVEMHPGMSRVFDKWRDFSIKVLKKKGIKSITQELATEMHSKYGYNYFRITKWGKNFADACAAGEFYEWNKFKKPDWAS